MRITVMLLLLSFVATTGFAQKKQKRKLEYSTAYHHGGNISIRHADGSQSTIYINGNSATLFHSDGSQSTMNCNGPNANLVAIDGTTATANSSGKTSTIFFADGTQLIVNHMVTSSTVGSSEGKHSISHTFGNNRERGNKNLVDVLMHMNWLVQKKKLIALRQLGFEKPASTN